MPVKEGSQIEEQVHWYQRDASVPGLLGTAGVPAEIAGLWVKLKLVGTERRSGLSRLQSRTGWGRDKLRKWMLRGWEMGWWVLLAEGAAARDGKTGTPRIWWLCQQPYEVPPQDYVTRVLKIRTLPPQPPAWGRVLKTSNLIFSNLIFRTLTRTLIDQQGLKRSKERVGACAPPARKASPKDLEAIYVVLDPGYRAKYGRALTRDKRNGKGALKAQEVFGDDLPAAWLNYLADPGNKNILKDNCHPLSGDWFSGHPDSYMPVRRAKPGPVVSELPPENPTMQSNTEAAAQAWQGLIKEQRQAILNRIHRPMFGAKAWATAVDGRIDAETGLGHAVAQAWTEFPREPEAQP